MVTSLLLGLQSLVCENVLLHLKIARDPLCSLYPNVSAMFIKIDPLTPFIDKDSYDLNPCHAMHELSRLEALFF